MDFYRFLVAVNSFLAFSMMTNGRNQRHERALLFPPSSTVGILAAIAVPLHEHKSVFLSYNFEANYNSPFMGSDYIPGPLTRLEIERSMKSGISNTTESVSRRTVKRSLVTRTNFYRIFERKLIASGFNGRECLLRLICEAADTPLGIHNGVFGDVLHIILTPSSSEREIIENEFYEAEIYGSHGKCDHYKANCPRSVFDFISVFEAV